MHDDSTSASDARPADKTAWKEAAAQYQQPSVGRSAWQMVNTLGPYALLWYLMHRSLAVSWWLTVPLAVLAGAFLVRVFIIFHDCGHGAFFKSRRANDTVGFITGLLTFTPYFHWRWEHAIHHATAGDLDRRNVGDIWTMTVQEYLEASPWKKFQYRLARNPVLLFVVAPLLLFLVWQRIPSPKANARERRSVHWMNLAIVGMAAAMSWAFGFKNYVLLQLIVMLVAGGGGVWMFYVQHQFEDVYWERGKDWDYTAAALRGSSFYKLPRVLQWFSGNIGFHHIHHLNPRIPNYNLEKCHQSHPVFQDVRPLTILSSLKSFNLRLWDEKLKRLVGYRHLKELNKPEHPSA
ncbi:MAG: fatty acid desaturase [Verrucomicrobia bacterium]|nr:fatty acid desaturase [Verrucomicrobiota bacterium]